MHMFLSVHIDAPKEAVFAAVSDFPNAPAIVPAIERVEMLSPARDGSAIGVGTRFKETRTVMGRQATETMEVTEFDPPRAYTLEAVSCGVRFICRVTVLDETPGRGGGGSRLSYDITTRPTTAWARVVGPVMGLLMKKAMRTSMEKDLADIKRYVEAGGGAPAGADEAGQARHGAPVG